MAGRIGQQRNDLRHLEDGAGPAVGDDEGQRVRPLATLVDEVNTHAIKGSAKVREAV
jgi:hypothetical protein